MDACILAAGKGTRLYPHTEHIPKPLLHIDGKPIIEHIIAQLATHNIHNVYFVVRYKKQMLIDFIESIKKTYNITPHYVYQDKLLGAAHAASFLPSALSDPFLLLLGDLFFYDFPKIDPTTPSILVKKSTDVVNKGIVEINKGKVTKIYYNKTPLKGERFIDLTFLVVPSKFIKYCKTYSYEGKETQLPPILNLMIKDGYTFIAQEYTGRFRHLTSQEDLDR